MDQHTAGTSEIVSGRQGPPAEEPAGSDQADRATEPVRRNFVFVSYAREDQHFVRRLAEALTGTGRDIWVDWDDIPPSAKWLDEIRAAIEAAQAVIFVMSPSSLASSICLEEVRHAVTLNKRLVPVVVNEPVDSPVPEELASLNWLFFRNEDDFGSSVRALGEALDTDLDWLRAHTKLLVQALEWQETGGDNSLLLRGRELENAEYWLATQRQNPQPTPAQAQFVLASRRAATGRQRRLVATAVSTLALMTVLALVAWLQRGEARSQARTALSRQLASDARTELETDPERALLLAMEAYDRKPTSEATSMLRQALVLSRVEATLREPGPVTAGTFSPDGKTVASGSEDGTIRLWDVALRTETKVLEGHEEPVTAVAFSPDGRFLVSAGDDSTLRLWDVRGGLAPQVLDDEADEIYSVTFSPDGRQILTGEDGAVQVRDVSNADKPRPLPNEEGFEYITGSGDDLVVRFRDANSVAVSQDGRLVAAAGEDGSIRVWDLVAGGGPTLLRGHSGEVYSVAFSPDGRFAVSGGDDRTVRLWDLDGSGDARLIGEQRTDVWAVGFSHDGQLVVSGTAAGEVKVWEVEREVSTDLIGHVGPVRSVSFSPDDSLVLTASGDGTLRLWDWTRGWTDALTGDADDANFSPDGRRAVLAGEDGVIREWDVDSRDQPRELGRHGGAVYSVAYSHDQELVVSAGDEGSSDASVRVWDVATGRLLGVMPVFIGHVFDAAFSPDGKRVVSASQDGIVRVWTWVSEGDTQELEGHADSVLAATFSPDGRQIASAGRDGTVRIWDLDRDGEATVLEGHEGPVASVAFSSEGNLVVSAGADKTVRVWDLRRKGTLRVLRGHVEIAASALITPDGRFVISVGSDGMFLWDLEQNQPRPVPFGPGARSISSNPDGLRMLAARGDEARIVKCEICRPAKDLRALAEGRVTRDLTPEDRATFLPE